ncbi:hypothetical protein L3X38_006266 [Prunus dulcis]|uniref:Pentatricopeptide repeat superfamily protein n=1 Tax=Prunus dulcis TaxID=3755 RepID=A0AAD5F506_PRUDU|nr:hypothetical protein L3X38_006266 [Prunus dulcis]
MIEHNAVSWTSLISGVVQSGLEDEALVLFNQMRKAPISLVEFTLAIVLGVCSGQKHVLVGEQLHGYTIKAGMISSIPVGNALVTMYAKCQNAHKANQTFELMPFKDIRLIFRIECQECQDFFSRFSQNRSQLQIFTNSKPSSPIFPSHQISLFLRIEKSLFEEVKD